MRNFSIIQISVFNYYGFYCNEMHKYQIPVYIQKQSSEKKKSFFVSAIYWFLKHFYYRTFISFKEEYSWNDYFFIRNKFNLTQQFSNHIIHNILLASRVFRKNLYSSECHGKKDGLFLSLDDKKKSELWFQIVTIIFEWKHFKTKDIFIIRFVSS